MHRGSILLSHNSFIFNLNFIFNYKSYIFVLLVPLLPLISSIISNFFLNIATLFSSTIKLSNFVINKTKTIYSNLVSSITKLPGFLLNKFKTISVGFRNIRVYLLNSSQGNTGGLSSDQMAQLAQLHANFRLAHSRLNYLLSILPTMRGIAQLNEIIISYRDYNLSIKHSHGLNTQYVGNNVINHSTSNVLNNRAIISAYGDITIAFANMIHYILRITRIDRNFSFNTFHLRNRIINEIARSNSLFSREEFTILVQQTLNSLNSNPSAEDTSAHDTSAEDTSAHDTSADNSSEQNTGT